MSDTPIGIFDSGVGGLTVAREVMTLLPKEHVVYFGDTLHCPYGPRGLDEVRGFVMEITEYLVALNVKLIVIACNTGTAAGLRDAQLAMDIPVVGVIEPGAHAAVHASVNRSIGVIGTKGTINSSSYTKAIHVHDAGIEVHTQVCADFVDYVERGETDGPEIRGVAEGYLGSLKGAGVDVVILGCTHYPLLTGVIGEVMGPDVELISSAKETAKEVRDILLRSGRLRQESTPPEHRFISTGDTGLFLTLGRRFLGREMKQVEAVVLASKASDAGRAEVQDSAGRPAATQGA